MIALAVIAVAVIGASFVPALRVGRSSDVRAYASNLGKETLETYRSLWQDPVAFQAATTPSLPTSLSFGCVIATPQVTSWAFDSSLALVTASTPNIQVQRVQVSIQCPNTPALQFTTEIGKP
jgi:hypothetical protein